MLNFPEIINKIERASKFLSFPSENPNEMLYNPDSEFLNHAEISKCLDEFNPIEDNYRDISPKTPHNKCKLRLSESPFINNFNEINVRNSIYQTPTPYKTPITTNKKSRSIFGDRQSPNFGAITGENKENFVKSTTKFKCIKGINSYKCDKN